eukprot:scaffold1205_cov249-Pinguiococcus_pyrenoidosus.AAC.10
MAQGDREVSFPLARLLRGVSQLRRRGLTLNIVSPFTAQIVDLVSAGVSSVEEALHFGHGVAINRLHALAGEAHGDDLGRHIGQIQVEVVLLEPALLLRHESADLHDPGGASTKVAACRTEFARPPTVFIMDLV